MQWIKTTEQLPEIGQRCIVDWEDQAVPHTATLFKDEFSADAYAVKWIASNGHTLRVHPLHWMPCPTRPERKNNGT